MFLLIAKRINHNSGLYMCDFYLQDARQIL